jgi:hypothetical protein
MWGQKTNHERFEPLIAPPSEMAEISRSKMISADPDSFQTPHFFPCLGCRLIAALLQKILWEI